jgi:AcrR family transcriptional regulator
VRARSGVWGGRTAEQRQAERRTRLIDAAIQILATSGWAAVTMRGVCAHTALNDRYFYEAFADRDELLAAVWDEVRDTVLSDIGAVLTESAADPPAKGLLKVISVVVERVSNDPVRTKILLGHHAGSSILEDRRASMVQQVADLVVDWATPHLKSDADLTGLRMDTFVAVGGFAELINAWQTRLVDVDAQLIIDHTSRLGATLAARYFVEQ